ncbi:MAG: sulfite exporter TauE/SafE family protein [bacterium]|nr:sulfite exporter TauE/SafE family protein [bacterium]
MSKLIIPIRGMHCRSCEFLLEDSLSEVAGVRQARVSHKRGNAEIFYQAAKPLDNDLAAAVSKAGYSIGVAQPKNWFNRDLKDYRDLSIALVILAAVYLTLKNTGVFGWGAGLAASSFSLPIVLLIGLTAGFSTCMALVGGIVLGISTRHAAAHPEASAWQKFRPHLYFNAGRIGGYAILGGFLGLVGGVLQLSSNITGLLTIVVGGVMLLLGLQLVEIFPRLTNWKFTLPKNVSRWLGIKKHTKEYSHTQAVVTGALTFFLPCGFTQAMQLYAVSSGSFTAGALIMGIFALGTAPGLLSVGGLTSVVKGLFAKRFFKFAGLVVIALAVFNLANGSRLLGWNASVLFSSSAKAAGAGAVATDPNVKLKNGVQVVTMTENNGGYTPNKFTIQKGIPVRWVIDAQAPYSCASSMVIPSLNRRFNLTPGENVIEFTPEKAGAMKFSCSMGMYTGVFNVVEAGAENQAAPDSQSSAAGTLAAGSCGGGGSGGCGGCGGGKPFVPNSATGSAQNELIPVADDSDAQVIKTAYTYNDDIQPNVFTVSAGKPVTLEIDVKENGSGCMSTIMIPGLYERAQYLQKGKKIVMSFTPQTKGEYPITCAMGVPRGLIKVL